MCAWEIIDDIQRNDETASVLYIFFFRQRKYKFEELTGQENNP